MSEIKELLEVRRELKERKPAFIRQDHQRRKRIGRRLRWKKPRGIHSKIRHHLKGRRKMPSPGYKSPSKVRGLHLSGMKIVNVSSAKEISNIKKETEGIVISKQVGIKKRFEILKRAKELGIEALNINIDENLKKIEQLINSKKKGKKETKDSKEKPETKEKEHKLELTEEQKKEMQKKEKDKLLTKKV